MRIKPLAWEKDTKHYPAHTAKSGEFSPEHYSVSYKASTSFGLFQVNLISVQAPHDGSFSREISWRYSYEEYYDEDSGSCKSLLEGKRKLEAEWQGRLMNDLEPEP